MSAPGVDLSAVVVAYNSPEWVRRSITALLEGAAREHTLEVVVVDNASAEPTRLLLDTLAADPRVSVHHSPENLGFGRACNLAVSRSSGRHVVLVNPDAVARPGSLDALLRFAEQDPGRGIVGGRTVTPDGRLDPSSCWGRPTLWSLFCFATGLSTIGHGNRLLDPESLGSWPRDTVREVGVVTGCLLLTSREVWDSLGGFDPSYFMYGEDADLSIRARRAGLRPSITPDAVVVHANGTSSATRLDKARLLYRGKAHLVRRLWHPPVQGAAVGMLLAGVALRAGLEAVASRLGRRPSSCWRELWRERATWRGGWTT